MRAFLLLLFCAAIPLASSGSAQALGGALSGRRAPSFSLPDSTLSQHDILDYRGKWLLIDFMKTDCPHCMALTKVMEDVKKQLGAQVAMLSIVIAPPENTVTVAKYIVDNKVTSPIVFDQGQVAAAYFKATPQRPGFDTPHLFIVSPAGNIVRDWQQMDQTKEIMEGPGLARELKALIAGTAK